MVSAEHICNPVSTRELERRWQAVRAAMAERDIDVLLMQNANSFHGGYVRWFTDSPAVNGGYAAVVFPRDDRMTTVRHGPPGESVVAADDPVHRGARKLLTAPTFAAVDYKKTLAADLVLSDLRPRMPATVGLVGTASMAHPFLDGIRNGGLPGARFVDATDLVDRLKALKSPEEIALIRQTAAMQDAVMEDVLQSVKPGKRNFELTALAQFAGQNRGSEQGIFLAGSQPLGCPNAYTVRHMQNRKIEAGDQFTLLIENNGPGGFYCELGRTCVLGKAPPELLDEFEFTLEAQRFTLSLLEPGARPAEILAAYNDFMRGNGKPEERRLHAHGQGYDMVERPLICEEETMTLAATMSLAVHPGYEMGAINSWVSDNYLLTEDGESERLHRTPQKIFEL